MNLMDLILNAQNGDAVRQMANSFQLDGGQTRSAMGALVPVLTPKGGGGGGGRIPGANPGAGISDGAA